MRGIGSHSLTRLTTYYRRAKEGLVDAKAEPKAMAPIVAELEALAKATGVPFPALM